MSFLFNFNFISNNKKRKKGKTKNRCFDLLSIMKTRYRQ